MTRPDSFWWMKPIGLLEAASADSAETYRTQTTPAFGGGGVVVSHEQHSHLNAPYRAYVLLSASKLIRWIGQDAQRL